MNKMLLAVAYLTSLSTYAHHSGPDSTLNNYYTFESRYTSCPAHEIEETDNITTVTYQRNITHEPLGFQQAAIDYHVLYTGIIKKENKTTGDFSDFGQTHFSFVQSKIEHKLSPTFKFPFLVKKNKILSTVDTAYELENELSSELKNVEILVNKCLTYNEKLFKSTDKTGIQLFQKINEVCQLEDSNYYYQLAPGFGIAKSTSYFHEIFESTPIGANDLEEQMAMALASKHCKDGDLLKILPVTVRITKRSASEEHPSLSLKRKMTELKELLEQSKTHITQYLNNDQRHFIDLINDEYSEGDEQSFYLSKKHATFNNPDQKIVSLFTQINNDLKYIDQNSTVITGKSISYVINTDKKWQKVIFSQDKTIDMNGENFVERFSLTSDPALRFISPVAKPFNINIISEGFQVYWPIYYGLNYSVEDLL